jgi:hypothetical protein
MEAPMKAKEARTAAVNSAPPPGAAHGWTEIYLRGLPVAVCPVERMDGDTLVLRCGPLEFLRSTRLNLRLEAETELREPARKVTGTVEAADPSYLTIRLEKQA